MRAGVLVAEYGGVEIPDRLWGRRVALRHRVGERDGRPLFSDAVGELSADDFAVRGAVNLFGTELSERIVLEFEVHLRTH